MESLIASELLACNIAGHVQRRNVENVFPPLSSLLILILMEECQHFFTSLSFLPYRHMEIKKKVSSKVGPPSLSTTPCVPSKHFLPKAYNHCRIH
jgi:hypothetical protein